MVDECDATGLRGLQMHRTAGARTRMNSDLFMEVKFMAGGGGGGGRGGLGGWVGGVGVSGFHGGGSEQVSASCWFCPCLTRSLMWF